MAKYYLSENDRNLLQKYIKSQRSSRKPLTRYKRRRSSVGSGGGGGNVTRISAESAAVILLDQDIDPGAEDEDPFMDELAGESVDEHDIQPNGNLNLWAFRPVRLQVKYFVYDPEGEEGTEEEGTNDEDPLFILATQLDVSEEGSEGSEGTDEVGVRYSERTVYYMEGSRFIRGDYTKADYPEYPEEDPWPPSGFPEDYFKKRYRALAIKDEFGRYWINFSTCQALPAPKIEE